MRPWASNLIAWATLTFVSAMACAQVENASAGYSIILAPGWTKVDDSSSTLGKTMAEAGFEFVEVYSPVTPWKPGAPTLLVYFQRMRTSLFTRETLGDVLMGEAAKKKGTTIASDFSQVFADPKATSAFFDQDHDRYAIASNSETGSHVVVVVYLMADGFMQFTFQAKPEEYATLQPQIVAMATGVRIRPEKAFAPERSGESTTSGNPGLRIVIAITIAAVGFGIAKSSLRKKRVAAKA